MLMKKNYYTMFKYYKDNSKIYTEYLQYLKELKEKGESGNVEAIVNKNDNNNNRYLVFLVEINVSRQDKYDRAA